MNLWLVSMGIARCSVNGTSDSVTALGQVEGSHEESIQQLVKETDLGKELDKVVDEWRITRGGEFSSVSGDVTNILMDKAENEAYDKIKIVHEREGIATYGVLYRWFADVSGLGLAE